MTRNGKTLLARLYADLLSLRKVDSPLIFDTDLTGNGIVNFFPKRTRSIDLSRVTDQVILFDTMLEMAVQDGGPDFVVDVGANELNRFFRIFSDIGFERGAFEAHLEIQVSHILSWTMKSLQTAAKIRNLLHKSRFVVVRNLAIEALPFTPGPEDEAKVPNIGIDLYLNALSPEAVRTISDIHFSFATFIEGGHDGLDYVLKIEIWNFLEDVHNQIRALA